MMYVVFLILVILCIFTRFTESFEIVGYNSGVLPIKFVPNVYETETKMMQKIFEDISIENGKYNVIFNTKSYSIYGDYIEFPFNDVLKEYLSSYIKNNVVSLKKDKIEINSDLNRIYWKDKGDDRIYIFNANLLNSTHFTSRNIIVKILIKNINNFIIKGEYMRDVSSELLIKSTDILSISLDRDNYKIFSINGNDDEKKFYEIKNTLYLMDPFITSDRDMYISNDMKRRFAIDHNLSS